ncbi:MAG: HAMP domain-containing sensor histidine kinase [Bacteroidales bacterium]|nr:HAMP domain-containing sensor histidine kinase [Bacteroidales bacterium]
MFNKVCSKSLYAFIIFFSFIIQTSTAGQLQDDRAKFIIDSLSSELKNADNWKDKKYILENLADITLIVNDKFNVLRELLTNAEKENDIDCQIETIRELGNTNDIALEDSLINKAKVITDKRPDAKSTLIFLQTRMESLTINNYDNGETRHKYITDKLLSSLNIINNNRQLDVYDRILINNNICLYLNFINSNGSIYTQSIEELIRLIKNLPKEDGFIKSLIYQRGALLYQNKEMYAESFKMDSLLIEHIESLKNQYIVKKSFFRNYDLNFLNIYIRQLGNYECLSKEAVENIFQNGLEYLHKTSETIPTETHKLSHNMLYLYHSLANNDYKKANDYINAILPLKKQKRPLYKLCEFKIQILNNITATPDSIMMYYNNYVTALKDHYNLLDKGKAQELNIIYNVNQLKDNNNKLKIDNMNLVIKAKNKTLFFSAALILLLFLISFVLTYLYINKKRVSKTLKDERDSLIKTQSELIIAKEKAERSEKLKSNFLANVSHEIRTPLNAIVGFSTILAESDEHEDKQQFINIIMNNNELLLKLINDILNLSKIEAGFEISKIQPFDVQATFDQVFMQTIERNTNKNIASFNIKTLKSCIIEADKESITQIIINFCSNALKYTKEGEIKTGISIEDNGLKIFCNDTGIGIPDDMQNKIFERFEKVDTFAQGSGLGLSICKAITEKYNGKIGFTSKVNEGSQFWAWIPCKIVSSEEI